ncbi:hypothetical protein PR202_gb28868 [Eleusine coracana subsp. coracana]|uniref:Uncharacterized protein n=1 Tax=Eleusine coracana subsp. coracana TaxID=191504 RepID=A0AAV5FYL6_ELECO|nr:hypothetical protein PR202_gb28868 [Eleusine coracana subsp. coracana]
MNLRIAGFGISELIPAAIGNLSNLKTMEIYCGGYIPGGYTSGTAPDTIGQLNKLRFLILEGCYFSGRIPESIANLTQLTKLDLSNNAFNGEIPSSIFTIPALRVLDLSFNQLSGPIQEFNQALSQLESVDLSNNEFSDLASLWRLKNIDILLLSNNKLSVMDSEDLHGNKIYGQLPRGLSNCRSLEVLDFGSNRIVDIFPSWLSGLPKLSVIVLRSNQFYGTMNDIDGDTKSELSGEIPQDLTNLTFLDVLNLSNNHLVGKIPQSHQLSTFDSSSFEGNAGLCGPQLSDLPCDASPYDPGVTNKHKSSDHVDVVLFLFVGLGFGIGFASAIVVKWGQFGRWISATARASRT